MKTTSKNVQSRRSEPAAAPLSLLPVLSTDARQRLRESIGRHKVRVPIVVSAGPAFAGEIADGVHRQELAAELGFPCPSQKRRFETEVDFLLYRLDCNLSRRQLPVAELVRLGWLLEPLERELAAGRKAQAAGGKRGEKSLPVSRPEEKGETRERVAERLGLSAATYTRASMVLREGSRELVAAFEANKESPNGAYRRLRSEQRRAGVRALAKEIEQNPPPLPQGRAAVLLVDPPWPYEGGMLPYPPMSVVEIGGLPICDLLAKDGIVWLWTTNAFLFEAQRIAREEWQLTERNILTWDKQRPGTGHWLRGETEHCLLLTRGKPVFVQNNYTTILRARSREHSRKPEEFYRLVEETCPGSKAELFARQQRPGWQAHGAETNLFPAQPGKPRKRF
jgi:N6-adenosine-specific RNA methylase IME4/ParB-like chromosome segregation protein Spo0J